MPYCIHGYKKLREVTAHWPFCVSGELWFLLQDKKKKEKIPVTVKGTLKGFLFFSLFFCSRWSWCGCLFPNCNTDLSMVTVFWTVWTTRLLGVCLCPLSLPLTHSLNSPSENQAQREINYLIVTMLTIMNKRNAQDGGQSILSHYCLSWWDNLFINVTFVHLWRYQTICHRGHLQIQQRALGNTFTGIAWRLWNSGCVGSFCGYSIQRFYHLTVQFQCCFQSCSTLLPRQRRHTNPVCVHVCL